MDPAENSSEKFTCSPTSSPVPEAASDARSESFMNTMALVEVIRPLAWQSSATSVSALDLPRSSALTISMTCDAQRPIGSVSPPRVFPTSRSVGLWEQARSVMTRLYLAAIGSARTLGFRSKVKSPEPDHGGGLGGGRHCKLPGSVTFAVCGLSHGFAAATAGT